MRMSGNLTEEQVAFLNDYTWGIWKVIPETGFIDVHGGGAIGFFDCRGQHLNDFKGLRFGKVTGLFNCSHNNLKTLEGSPREVMGSFYCQGNPLISLEGAPLKVGGCFYINNFPISYNITAFLEEIKKDKPGVPELLLTHQFLTPEVIKGEITKDSYFCYYVSRAWNNPPFKKKQEELSKILAQEDLQKIDALWSIGGYL